jgi:hypothetical protein
MNRKAVVVILGLAVLGYSAQAAQWQYKNNYFVSQAQSRAYSAIAEDPIGAREGAMASYVSQDPSYAYSSTTSTIYDPSYTYGSGNSYGYLYYTSTASASPPDASKSNASQSGLQQLTVYLTASSSGSSESMDCFAEGSGRTVTGEAGGTDGIFFIIMPDAGENFGDLVRVQVLWNAYANAAGDSIIETNGGDGKPRITISRTLLGSEQELWGRDGVSLHDPNFMSVNYYDDENTTFTARIGDTIGIYMGTSASSQFSGVYSQASVNLNLSLTLKTVMPGNPADLNADGSVDMQDLSVFADNCLWQAKWPNYHDTCATAIEAALNTLYEGDTGPTDTGYVWYRFTPAEDGVYNFNLCGMKYIQMYLYDDCGGADIGYSGLTCYEGLPLRIHLTAGHPYYIAIYGGSGSSNLYEFSIDNTPITAPVNDDCTNAIPVEANGEVYGQTWSATGSDISSCVNGDSMDVWYLFTAPSDGSYVFQVYPNNQFMAGSVSLYETDPLGCAGTELLCSSFPMEEGPDHQGGGWPTLSMTAGQAILIRVASAPGHEGYFGMYIYPQ